jgi:prefoldin subunit 5
VVTKQRSVKFSKPEDVNPVELERIFQHYDDVVSGIVNQINSLETALNELKTRVSTLEATP